MVQRVVRQIKSSALGADITIATGESQRDAISCQLGDTVGVVTEPERRDTFPAIALACLYLSKQKGCAADEPVVVMPSDPYIDDSYFDAIGRMVEAVEGDVANLVLMGIRPDYPSTKFGYIVPEAASGNNVADAMRVKRFTEKPTAEKAVELISLGALWNGGVFAFRLGYLLEIISKYVDCGHSFDELRSCYSCFPKISFDYEVAEKADSVAVVPFAGVWKDLGTWNALSEVLGSSTIGKSTLDSASVNTHVVNRLGIPCLCIVLGPRTWLLLPVLTEFSLHTRTAVSQSSLMLSACVHARCLRSAAGEHIRCLNTIMVENQNPIRLLSTFSSMQVKTLAIKPITIAQKFGHLLKARAN